MKKAIVTTLLLSITFITFSKGRTCYIAYSTGVNIRKTPNLGAELLGKIPYGTKITIDDAKTDTAAIIVEGMTGYWTPVSFQNKKGYILNCYITNIVPPKKGTKTMSDYLLQLSPKFGAALVYKSQEKASFAENGYTITKQFYKNGNEQHTISGYESFGNTYFFIGLQTLQEAFLVMRQIEEFHTFFSEQDAFPTETKVVQKKVPHNLEPLELSYKVYKETSFNFIKRIELSFQEGSFNELELFYLDGQIVISYGGGV